MDRAGEAGEERERAEVEKEEEKRDEKERVGEENITISRLQTPHHPTHLHVMPRGGGDASLIQTPTPQQQSLTSLNSRAYTNRITLFIFLVHMVAATAAICFFGFKAVEGIVSTRGSRRQQKEKEELEFWLPPIEGSAIISILLAWGWQKGVRMWPAIMIRFILWCSFIVTMVAGSLLLCFSMPATAGIGAALIIFSIGNGLYACWVTHRIDFSSKVLKKSMDPVPKFPDLNQPTYWMLVIGFIWMSLWNFAVIGALNFYYPGLTILALLLSLAWTMEVMRNVANLTVSRVISLFYLRGIQSNTPFCFQRAISRNLGSACLGSLFVPTIEALRIIARALNLLEGEDEFMFSCAHCCLRVMETIFRYGNSWAFVHVAAYGRGFVSASQSTWGMFQRHEGMGCVVDSDITSSVCFLSGVTSGSICLIFASSWTFSLHKSYTATVSLLTFFNGYLMTRISMALPQACVSCYYVCYAENPTSRLFDNTIPNRLDMLRARRDVVVPTPRFPRPLAAD